MKVYMIEGFFYVGVYQRMCPELVVNTYKETVDDGY